MSFPPKQNSLRASKSSAEAIVSIIIDHDPNEFSKSGDLILTQLTSSINYLIRNQPNPTKFFVRNSQSMDATTIDVTSGMTAPSITSKNLEVNLNEPRVGNGSSSNFNWDAWTDVIDHMKILYESSTLAYIIFLTWRDENLLREKWKPIIKLINKNSSGGSHHFCFIQIDRSGISPSCDSSLCAFFTKKCSNKGSVSVRNIENSKWAIAMTFYWISTDLRNGRQHWERSRRLKKFQKNEKRAEVKARKCLFFEEEFAIKIQNIPPTISPAHVHAIFSQWGQCQLTDHGIDQVGSRWVIVVYGSDMEQLDAFLHGDGYSLLGHSLNVSAWAEKEEEAKSEGEINQLNETESNDMSKFWEDLHDVCFIISCLLVLTCALIFWRSYRRSIEN